MPKMKTKRKEKEEKKRREKRYVRNRTREFRHTEL